MTTTRALALVVTVEMRAVVVVVALAVVLVVVERAAKLVVDMVLTRVAAVSAKPSVAQGSDRVHVVLVHVLRVVLGLRSLVQYAHDLVELTSMGTVSLVQGDARRRARVRRCRRGDGEARVRQRRWTVRQASEAGFVDIQEDFTCNCVSILGALAPEPKDADQRYIGKNTGHALWLWL